MDSYEFLAKQKERMVIKERARIESEIIDQLCDALKTAINTVECASLDKNGQELPWYKQAHAALRTAGRPWQSDSTAKPSGGTGGI